jgi:hypothetical protein
MRGRKSDGSMQVVSSFTPCPWPSRFSSVEQTEVKIPPKSVSKPYLRMKDGSYLPRV